MKKKMMAAALVGAMALSLSVPALAANETVVTATYAEPKIEVSVPTTATAVINPYQLPCKYSYDPDTGKTVKTGTDGAVDFALDSDTSKTAVATQPMILVNYGETALDVSATPTVTIKSGSDLILVETVTQSDESTTQDKAMSIQISGATLTGAAASWDEESKKLKMDAGLATAWLGADFGGGTKTEAFAIAKEKIGTAVAGTEKKLGTLAAIHAVKNGSTDADKKVTVRDDCMLAVAVMSDAVKKPKTAWTAKDIVTISIAYTFDVSSGT